MTIRYKGATREGETSFRDPVSEVDHRVESLIRLRLAERFPQHDVIGEEIDERPGRDHDFVWAVDPIDGTTNFINGFPLFSASIGVLFRGKPMVGALWCSTSHTLTAGVYHARRGGRLYFNEDPVEVVANPGVRRRLAGMPGGASGAFPWEMRKTGSAAIECAFVAAGLLGVSYIASPNLWDVAGGVALVEAAGGEARMKVEDGWRPAHFGPLGTEKPGGFDIARWRRPLVVGEPEAVDLLCRNLVSSADARS